MCNSVWLQERKSSGRANESIVSLSLSLLCANRLLVQTRVDKECDWTRRFFLPVPFRTNVTLLFGAPIAVEKKENPSEAEVDAVHQQMLEAFVTLFDTHKAALGWSHRSLTII